MAGMERLRELKVLVYSRCMYDTDVDDVQPVRWVDLVVIEGYSYGSPNQAAHLGELGGVVRLGFHTNGVTYVDVPPASLKKFATGVGNAGKEQILVEAVKRLGYQGSSNDEADALWLRAMGLAALGEPVVQLPAKNLEALAAVAWPAVGADCVGTG